jgi:hypothetical protein
LDHTAKVYSESGLTQLHALREQQVREEIAGRLRDVCATFPDAEFKELVGEMAERQLRDERRLIW